MSKQRDVRQVINSGSYPARRLRRNRKAAWARNLIREHRLHPSNLIWPLFVIEGTKKSEPIASMPGVERLSIDLICKAAEEAANLGICAIALFPNTDPSLRTPTGFEAFNDKNLICRAVRAVKKQIPHIGIICDVALDPYTDHGHDGLIKDGDVVNDATVEALVKQALVQAEAGCDIIAPSDMMDGRVGAIRQALETHKHHNVQIMAYTAKYASSLYHPFRDAVGSNTTLKGSKATYQMDMGNGLEAIDEALLDIQEGADMIMVKPGLFYLDIVKQLATLTPSPVFAYQVSGEYAMMVQSIHQGLFQKDALMEESLLAFKRAGARGVLTYFAKDMAMRLKAASMEI